MQLHRRSATSEDAQRSKLSIPHTTRRNATVPQPSRYQTNGSNATLVSRNRLSVTDSSSSGQRSAGSGDEGSFAAKGRRQPSTLPRSTYGQSNARLEAIASSRPLPSPFTTSQSKPEPVSKSIGVYERDRTTNMLRRKTPSIEQYTIRHRQEDQRTQQTATTSPLHYSSDLETDAIFGIAFPEPRKQLKTKIKIPAMASRSRIDELPPSLIPELQALAASSELTRAQATPAVVSMSSPSSMYSDSPEPWSSRNTTPLSMSSYSPGIVQSMKFNTPLRRLPMPSQSKETKPRPNEAQRTEMPKLPVVQETLSSVSSGHNAADPVTPQKDIERRRGKNTPSPAPNPPPRKSSVKFKPQKTQDLSDGDRQEGNVIDTHETPTGVADRPTTVTDLNVVEQPSQLASAVPSFGRAPGRPLEQRAMETTDLVVESVAEPDRSRRRPGMRYTDGPRAHEHSQPRELFAGRTLPKHPAPSSKQDGAAEAGLRALPTVPNNSSHLSSRDRRLVEPRHLVKSRGVQKPDQAKDQSTLRSTTLQPLVPAPKSGLRAFFSRRTKPTPVVNEPPRKGPTAGTGHEGYRKHTFRSRKTSTESTSSSDSRAMSRGIITPRPSTSRKDSHSIRRDSRNSKVDPELDGFVAQRLEPVVIVGGGGYRNRLDTDAPTAWSQADNGIPRLERGGVFFDTRNLASGMQHETESQMGYVPTTSIKPSLAPIETGIPSVLPVFHSYHTSQSSLAPSDSTIPAVENEMHKVDARYLKKPTKKGRSLKWNIFQRGQNANKTPSTTEPDTRQVTEMPVTITTVPNPRSVPYYAVMDSETDVDNSISDTLGDFLAEVVESPSAQKDDPLPYYRNRRQQHGNSVLLPSLPALQQTRDILDRPASPIVPLRREAVGLPDQTRSIDDPKPRRLAQVGRIPRVISRKDHRHIPPVASYSRPFSRGRMEPVPALTVNTTVADAQRPILGIQTDILPSRPFDEFDSGKPASAPARAMAMQDRSNAQNDKEFLAFASKHGSEVSVSSSSEGIPSFAAPRGLLPIVHHHGDEEVWNEYDELIDRVLSPTSAEVAHLAPLSTGDLVDYMTVSGKSLGPVDEDSGMSLGTMATQNPSMLAPSNWLASSRVQDGLGEDYRLRRSRIVSALHSSVSPSSPFSLADLVAEYEERNRFSARLSQRTRDSARAEATLLPPLTYGDSPGIQKPIPSHHQNTFLLDVAERDQEGPAAQSDLHFAAMMTSKWLSFGRVLFSPAQQEIEDRSGQHDILVIDGLGNSDWSFYCALTYPSATIYDLKESHITPRTGNQNPWGAPPNYRSVEQASLAERFPFATSFFTAVVLRFPPAMPDGILKLMLSECKRVLVPGGHIEISLLDIDMVNMGTYTRRAVRDLKVRMNVADPEVSLKPVSDNIQNMLGRKGFETLNRCVLGIPVAGKVAGSIDSSASASSRSSKGSYTQTARDPVKGEVMTGRVGTTKRHHEQNNNFSLSDLITDHSPTSDEKITKMVAKVGRYWYTRIYESGVLPDGDLKRSIWADKKVLHECKNRGSGFKLLIAYAQKPIEHRRRTVSEPSLPTLVTAGTPAMNSMR